MSRNHHIPTDLLPYYTFCSDITVFKGILLKNESIIVLSTFRAEMKSLIQQGHLGIENCKKRARQSLFWLLMNSEIEDMIKKCPACLTFRNRHPNEPLTSQFQIKPRQKMTQILFAYTGINIY